MTHPEVQIRTVRRMIRESVPRPPRRLLVDFVSGVDHEVPVARVVYGSSVELTFAAWEAPEIGTWLAQVAAGERFLSSALPVAEARRRLPREGSRITASAWRRMRESWRQCPRGAGSRRTD